MGKKKKEHVVFDQMLKTKKSIPFSMVNKQNVKGKKTNKLCETQVKDGLKATEFKFAQVRKHSAYRSDKF